MGAIYKKELRSYLNGMIGAVFTAFILLVAGIYIAGVNFASGYAQFEYSISYISFMFLPAIPVLTMRSISEEKSVRTDQLLYSLPMSLSKIIMAKYFAIVTVLAVPMLVLGIVPLVMSMYGSVHFAVAYASLFATFMLGCALAAVGMFLSSVTESQVIAAVMSIAAFLVFYMITALSSMIPSGAFASMVLFGCLAVVLAAAVYLLTKNAAVSLCTGIVLVGIDVGLYFYDQSMFKGAFAKLLSVLDMFGRTSNFYEGIFDLSAVVYYLSVIVLFVFLTVQSMEKKRWSEVD